MMPDLCNPEVVSFQESSDNVFEKKNDMMRADSPKSEASSGVYDVSSTSSEVGSVKDNLSDAGECSDVGELSEETLHEEMAQLQLNSGEDAAEINLEENSGSQQHAVPGQALRDVAQAQRDAMEQHEKRKSVKPPPGFEKLYGIGSGSPVVTTKSQQQPEPVLVSYADGSNTMTLSAEPLCLHNITVASTEDACHVFIKQMNNPTHAGLEPLEEAMQEAYQLESGPELLRPIATGSLLAVKSDSKWYRCQVVSYNDATDTCDIKFVDHGGYTTVPVSDLRQLRSDFIRLPFQAIEVYLAHISPATEEIVIDIVSDILFRDEVSVNMVGYAEDGVPVVQAFFYVNDFVHLLTQDIVDESLQVLKSTFPDYTPVPTKYLQQHEQPVLVTGETDGETCQQEDHECATYTDWSAEVDAEDDVDEGVWSGGSSNATESEPARSHLNSPVSVADTDQDIQEPESQSPACPIVYSTDVPAVQFIADGCTMAPSCDQLVPVPEVMPVLTYCVQDPGTGVMYYVATPVIAQVPAPHQIYVNHEENFDQSHETSQQLDKPFQEWTQEDYENYYQQE